MTRKVFLPDTKNRAENILAKWINRINRDLDKIVFAKKEILNPVVVI